MEMIMAKTRARNSKGRFTKGGGGSTAIATRPRTRTVTKTKYKTRHVQVKAKRRRGRGKHHSGTPTLGKILITAGAAGFLLSDKSPLPQVKTFLTDKVPGGKTFGPVATAGAIAFGLDRFWRPNPWFKALAIVGLASAAMEVGKQNTAFKFLGDEDGSEGYVADVD
jgi:hypothetical protein